MSELHNPLFDEEKEFLERKKLEYERALRGDVDYIKDQSVMVGKVALVGAGLAGSIWLIAKAFSGKKRWRRAGREADDNGAEYNGADDEASRDQAAPDYEAGATYFTAGNGKRYKSTGTYKSAADSARVFAEQRELDHEADDLGFGATAPAPPAKAAPETSAAANANARATASFDAPDFEDDDPFRDLPYDDSRRLTVSHAFDDESDQTAPAARTGMFGAVLQAFLKSDTGKVLVAQAAAVALALVTKKLGEFFPAAKNSDLATSPGHAPAETGFSPVAPPASPNFLDAPTHSQSI